MNAVVVLGSRGTLGREVVRQLQALNIRWQPAILHDAIEFAKMHDNAPIINCAGKIPQKNPTVADMIYSNALLPHLLDDLNRIQEYPIERIIHMSTDCVFGHPTGTFPVYRRNVNDQTDPIDDYGRSKALGEVSSWRFTNVRGSFITPTAGFWKWVEDSINANDGAMGWSRAYWNGCTVEQMAAILIRLATQAEQPKNIVHVGSLEISTKWEMMFNIAHEMGRDDWVHDYTRFDYSVQIERVLNPTIVTPFIHDSIKDYYRAR